ncbi:MAG: DUF342 domain-containing protein [Betaproteobacteria bacterium]|nr:DUF342 domain-containing protein [Betaproteobacteria bacterium]MDE2623408.1 DUF342 domain-containing protein [Betaproteobacteria bacterium]
MPETAENRQTGHTAPPSYILLQDDGVYVFIPAVPSQEMLREFADRIFDNGTYFVGLDYPVFMALLYGNTPLAQLGNGGDRVKFATRVAALPFARLDLYKGLKIDRKGEQAEYLFEPVFLESTRSEPVYGEPGPDGTRPVIKERLVTEQLPVRLDFDEFVAALWRKGLRFGIDERAAREAIRTGTVGRIPVAFHRPPTDSRDAEIREESDRLHQDRSPLVLPNGRIDIRKAKNRFPQVTKDTVLLRKIPRVLGDPGYRVTGTEIEPRIPTDIVLEKLAGEGTRVDHTAAGDILVANRDGFLSVDSHSGMVRISTKIENKEGISIKATGGDLSLEVDDFTEHGDVQEGRVVEGKNLTFHGTVYGSAISRNGKILMNGNLSNGRAVATDGDIIIRGKAINSRLEAMDGEIQIDTAEECTILGKNITITHAVNCEIVAEQLNARSIEGCAVAGMNVLVGSSSQRKFNESIISVVLPDIPALDRQIAETQEKIGKLEHELKVRYQRLVASQSNDGFANFLLLREKVEAGTVKLTPEQQDGFEKLAARFAPLLQSTEDISRKLIELKADLAMQEENRNSSGLTERCEVDKVIGDTVVQKLVSGTGINDFPKLSSQQIKVLLRQVRDKNERLFAGNSGRVVYQVSSPD